MPRPQFTIRALLVAMLVVAAFFGGVRFERERRRQADEAAAAQAVFQRSRRLVNELNAQQQRLIKANANLLNAMEGLAGGNCRVERWRGGLGVAYPLAGPFVCRCLNSQTVLRFHLPLIEPDRQISRIRLSDKKSRFRPRKVARSRGEPD
jgi:hypothetical protein